MYEICIKCRKIIFFKDFFKNFQRLFQRRRKVEKTGGKYVIIISMNIQNKITKGILTGFYMVFTPLTGLILVLSVAHPLNYLPSLKMGIGTVIFFVFFLGFCVLTDYIHKKIFHAGGKNENLTGRKLKLSFLLLAGLYWVALYVICAVHGNGYHVVGDYEILYLSALEMADGKELSFSHYFMTYGNNTSPMLLLAGLFKISHLIGMNEFYPVLIFSTGTVTASLWAMGELLPGRGKWNFFALILMILCLPVYVFSGAFYTDTLSLGMGVIVLAVLKNIIVKEKNAAWMVLAAVLTVWGALWKITSLIVLIAAVVAGLVLLPEKKLPGEKQQEKKQQEKKIAVRLLFYLGSTVILYGGVIFAFRQVPIYRDSKEYANPTMAWVALGMRGNGSYSDSVEFSDYVNELETKEEKSAYIREYMQEHRAEAFSPKHLIAKIQHNYAGGTFTCSDFTTNLTGHSVLWSLMDPGGRWYYRTSGFMFCYIGAIYGALFLGGILSLKKLLGKEKCELDFMKVTADISFFGLFLFLMVWESNNRQLYNQLPVMLIGLFGTGELFTEVFSPEKILNRNSV